MPPASALHAALDRLTQKGKFLCPLSNTSPFPSAIPLFRLLGWAFLGFLLSASASFANESKPPKNGLFIITDDLNCNIGAYGHPLLQTPHLDQLSQEGLIFQNAYTIYPSCGQSRASFMTGLYPKQNGVTQLRRLFRDHVPDAVTMSQHFQRQGYTAVRVGKIYHYNVPLGIGSDGHDDPASSDRRQSFRKSLGPLRAVCHPIP